MEDTIFIIVIILLVIVCLILLMFLKKKDKKRLTMKNGMIDLESITKNIEETYKPVNVKLTSYEQEQEDNAIISYEELLSSSNKEDKKEDSYTNVNLDNNLNNENVMNYEKEEAFLKALKQLKIDLAR